MTLTVHLVWSAVRRSWVARVLKVVVAVLLELLNTARGSLVLTWNLSAGLIADGWELDGSTSLLVTWGRSAIAGVWAFGRNGGGSGTLFISLSLVLLLLLASLPLLSNLLEFCKEHMLVH